MSGPWNKRGDVQRGDLPYEITHLMSNAQAQAVITAAAADGRDVWMRDGTHADRSLTIPNGNRTRIFGAGQRNTLLAPNSNGDTVIALTAGQITHSLSLTAFSIVGSKAGSGHGIHIPSTATVFNSTFEDLAIEKMGGHGFFDQATTFSVILRNLRIDDCLDDLFDIAGSVCYTLENCYAQAVPTSGKAGFRIRGGYTTMIGCNGINSGDHWAIFGQSVALDGVLTYAYPHLIGCNIEDFAVSGLRSRNNGMFLENCVFVAPASGVVRAIDFQSGLNKAGTMLAHNGFLSKGATWEDGSQIHGWGTVPPFNSFTGSGNPVSDSYTFRDRANTTNEVVSRQDTERVAFLRHAVRFRDLKFSERLYKGSVANVFDSTGTGSPEGVLTAAVGSLYSRTDGGAGTTLYVKESGTGNTGWVAK